VLEHEQAGLPRGEPGRTFANAVVPLADAVLDRVTRGIDTTVLKQEAERLLRALARRDKDVLDVGRVEHLALADDAAAQFAQDVLALLGQRDVGQAGLCVRSRGQRLE